MTGLLERLGVVHLVRDLSDFPVADAADGAGEDVGHDGVDLRGRERAAADLDEVLEIVRGAAAAELGFIELPALDGVLALLAALFPAAIGRANAPEQFVEAFGLDLGRGLKQLAQPRGFDLGRSLKQS
jgi:hypothetical protein